MDAHSWHGIRVFDAVYYGCVVIVSLIIGYACTGKLRLGRFFCLFGHGRKYLVIRPRNHESCSHGYETLPCCGNQVYRWVCGRCPAMGQEFTKGGWYKIVDGKLLPDAQGWSDFRNGR